MMLKKKEENQNYAETCRQKEMSDWKNRYFNILNLINSFL